MNLIFSKQSWEEYLYWQKADPKTFVRINDLIRDIKRHPYSGIGKPEPLKHRHKGYWSRRIDREHRIIYKVSDDGIRIAKCRYHYS